MANLVQNCWFEKNKRVAHSNYMLNNIISKRMSKNDKFNKDFKFQCVNAESSLLINQPILIFLLKSLVLN